MFNIHQVAKVFRVITKFLLLKENENELKTEGIFRVPGTDKAVRKIIANILSDNTNHSKLSWTKTFKIHEYVSAMKVVLLEGELLNHNDLSVEFQKDVIEKSNSDQGAHELSNFVENLIKSPAEAEYLTGEIFYLYFTLAKSVVKFQAQNNMNADNLAKMLGPNFERLISKGDNLKETALLTLKLNDMCRVILEGDDFMEKWTPAIIAKKRNQLLSLVNQKEKSEEQKGAYLNQIEEYEENIKAEKKGYYKANKKSKEVRKAKIKSYEDSIAIVKKGLKEEAEPKLKEISAQIEMLRSEIEELEERHPIKPPVIARTESEAEIPALLMTLGDDLKDIQDEIDKKAPPANDAPVAPPVVFKEPAPKAVVLKKTNRVEPIELRLRKK